MQKEFEHIADLPSHLSFEDIYHRLAEEFIPEEKTNKKQIISLVMCFLTAAIASYYNYQFGAAYMKNVAKRWDLDDTSATIFGDFCGVIGFIINASINTKSLDNAIDVIRDLYKQIREKNEQRPDDNMVKIVTGVMVMLSILGCIPNLKFVYDTTSENDIYRAFMLIAQGVTVTALNLRGVHNSFKLSTEKKLVAHEFKRDLLRIISQCIVDENTRFSENDLQLLSEGILVRKRMIIARRATQAALIGVSGAYSATFWRACTAAFSVKHYSPPFDGLASFGIGTVSLIAGGLKWLLLGQAIYRLMDDLYSLADPAILSLRGRDIETQFIKRRGRVLITSMFALIAVFSIGSACKAVETYLFNDDQARETFWLAFTIAFLSVIFLHTMDISNLFIRFLNFSYDRMVARKQLYTERFGESHDHMMMIVMSKIAAMPEDVFLRTFTSEKSHTQVKLDGDNNDDTAALTLEEVKEKYTKSGYYGHGYIMNDKCVTLIQHLHKLRQVNDDHAFKAFKEHESRGHAGVDIEMEEQSHHLLSTLPISRLSQ